MWHFEENERSLSGMFDHCTLEALLMYWLKKDMLKVSIAIAGILLLMVSVQVSGVDVHERASGLATPGTVMVQMTPTEDATITTLNKVKLAKEVDQLRKSGSF
jgi:hypothetical protein